MEQLRQAELERQRTLRMSELQLDTDKAQIGEEVTLDPRYYNSNLIENPFSEWK